MSLTKILYMYIYTYVCMCVHEDMRYLKLLRVTGCVKICLQLKNKANEQHLIRNK